MNIAILEKLFYEKLHIIESEISYQTRGLTKLSYFSPDEVECLKADLLLKAWISLAQYDSQVAPLRHYLRKVLQRAKIDFIRKKKLQTRNYSVEVILEEMELGMSEAFSEFFYAPNECKYIDIDFKEAVSSFPKELKDVFYLLEMSYSAVEISKILKKSRNTINKRIAEIRRILRKIQ